MILKALQFHWSIIDDEKVVFSVNENVAHSIHQKYYSNGKIPPLTERIKYAKCLGASEEKIKIMIKNHMQNKKDAEKNQEIIDKIFSKFNIKPAKKKILKPVKKI